MALNRFDRIIYNDEDDDIDEFNLIFFGIPRRLLTRSNYFETLDQWTFFQRFRVTKETGLFLLNLIEQEIEYINDLNNSVSPINQLLIFLRLCATGSHQSCIADFVGVHTSTVSRIIPRVARAFARHLPDFVRMPVTEADRKRAQHEFYLISRFPRTLAAVDCTHVKIKSPGHDAEVFRNRKSYFSINVQALCNANLEILDIVSRWPGSTHDVTIFNNSEICRRFERNEFPNSLILGDSGYYLKSYLLTPILNPATQAEVLYNEAHIRTRNVIERTFGGLKIRFPILAYGTRLKLQTTLSLIVALAVVYNICKMRNEPPPPPPDELEQLLRILEEDQVPVVPVHEPLVHNLGHETRRNFIVNYFSHLNE